MNRHRHFDGRVLPFFGFFWRLRRFIKAPDLAVLLVLSLPLSEQDESLVQKPGADPEVGLFDRIKDRLQIDDPPVRRQFQEADRTDGLKMPLDGGPTTATLIDDEQVRREFLGEGDGSILPRMETGDRFDGCWRENLQPIRGRCDESTDRSPTIRRRQFGRHLGGDDDFLEKSREHLDAPHGGHHYER